MRPTSFEQRDISSSPTALFTRDNVTGTVNFDPANIGSCLDTEIQISFKTKLILNTYSAYRINTPGIRIGDCMSTTQVQNGTRLMASWPFKVTFFEGNVTDCFAGSYIIAEYYEELLSPPDLTAGFKLVLDRSNSLKRTCNTGTYWKVYRYIATPLFPYDSYPTMAPTAADTTVYPPSRYFNVMSNVAVPTSMPTGIIQAFEHPFSSGYVGYLVNKNTYNLNLGFFYYAGLTFSPAMQHFDTTINVTIAIGFPISSGDYITLALPGFTNNNETALPRNPGLDYTVSDTLTTGATKALWRLTTGDTLQVGVHPEANAWTGTWHEGSGNSRGDSYIELVAHKNYPAGVPISIIVDKCPNKLISLYGRPPNYKGFTIKVTGSSFVTETFAPTPIDGKGTAKRTTRFSTQAIGGNCREHNFCNGNGICHHDTSTCQCFTGWGSAYDRLRAVSDNFNADCSSQVCPSGPAGASLPRNATTGMHREVECSSSGRCDRTTGHCHCFPGFEGTACHRTNCPRPNGDPAQPVCSNRGVCKRMSHLSLDAKALPLSPNAFKYTTVFRNGVKSSWDADRSQACVCDSSWDVGLGPYQTQLGEFFGPACEFRRCPSGDNPDTTLVDETDCEGKAQTGGSSLGQAHNICHVDCSNRGLCDFKTGVCTCFSGYYGANCGSRRTDTSPQTRGVPILNNL